MKKKQILMSWIMALATTTVCAADRTWTGGGSDANWNTSGNWGGTAPVAGDALFFGGTSGVVNTNDLTADTSFIGITFNNDAGAFSLSGNRLSLGGDLVNLDVDTQTINLALLLSATRTLNASNGFITINGILSGSGGVTKTGSKPLTLTGDNSYTGVTTVKPNSSLRIQSDYALGSTNGATVVENGGWLEISGDITVDETITISGDNSTSYGGVLRNTGGINTWNGPITCASSRIKATSGTLIITGGITGPGLILASDGTGTVIITNKPVDIGSGTIHAHSSGKKIFQVANNVWGHMDASGSILRTDVPNAFPPTATLQMGVSYSPNSYVDLNGNDQSVGRIYRGTSITGNRELTSTLPATLTINQSANTTLDAKFTGAVKVTKTGTGILTLTNAVWTTTGDITVSNGTLTVLAGTTFSESSTLRAAGGILKLQTETAINNEGAVAIENGGVVEIDSDLTETIASLSLDGVAQFRGTYGATGSGADTIDDVHFDGSGILYVSRNPPVTPVSATWDDGGSDTLLSTTNNWDGDVLPAFDGTTDATFAFAGTTATVDIDAGFYGITLNHDSNFLLEAGDGSVVLGSNGINAAVPTGTTRTYTLAEDIELLETQEWTLDNSAGATIVTVSGVISDGDYTSDLTVNGGGWLNLSASNTFGGAMLIETGVVRITHSQALGSTVGGTTVNTLGRARLELSGELTIDEPLTFIGNSNSKYCLQNVSGTNTLTSMINMGNGRFYVGSTGKKLIISGGMTGNTFFVINGIGTLLIETTPLTMGTGTLYADDRGLTILNVASNQFGSATMAKGTVQMNVAHAMPPNANVRIGVGYGPWGTFDLNGYDQEIGYLHVGSTAEGVRQVTSATPAMLTVNQTTDKTFDGDLNGELGLIKAGSSQLVLAGTNSTAAGSMIVSNGTLVVAANATLGTSTNVVVASGTLSLQTQTAIADNAMLSIDNGAHLTLATGVNEEVRYLVINDIYMPVGTYGATGSGAQFINDTHFASTGMLTVMRSQHPGSIIIVR
jgi:autotransporter-associated beta strand protein